MQEEPQHTASILGLTLAGTVASSRDFHENVLSSYLSVLTVIASSMAESKTSYALRGFLHDPDCISYWHYTGVIAPPFSQGDSTSVSTFPVEVYLIGVAPTDETLMQFNEAILRSSKRALESGARDYWSNPAISQVERIRGFDVDGLRLENDDEVRPTLFGGNVQSKVPRSFTYEIPFGAPALVPLLESFVAAQALPSRVREGTEATKMKALDLLEGPDLPSSAGQ